MNAENREKSYYQIDLTDATECVEEVSKEEQKIGQHANFEI